MKEEAIKSIDEAISSFMCEQKISQTQMAGLMNMTPNTLRAKRKGEYDWSLSEIINLADLTGKSPDTLVGTISQKSHVHTPRR